MVQNKYRKWEEMRDAEIRDYLTISFPKYSLSESWTFLAQM